MVVVGVGDTTAVAPIANAGVVTHLGGGATAYDAVLSDPRGVHRGVTVGIGADPAQGVKLRPLTFGHDESVNGLGAGVGRSIDLIQKVGGAKRVLQRDHKRIDALLTLSILGGNKEFNHNPLRMRRNRGCKDAVRCETVVVQSVIKHRGLGEGRLTIDSPM